VELFEPVETAFDHVAAGVEQRVERGPPCAKPRTWSRYACECQEPCAVTSRSRRCGSALLTHLDVSLAAVIGTMGGDSQRQILLHFLTRLLITGDSVGQAVAVPRWVLSEPAHIRISNGATVGRDHGHRTGHSLPVLRTHGESFKTAGRAAESPRGRGSTARTDTRTVGAAR
jgi:gamma-glutamyltranspeptidase